jgi:pyrimidine operon attenuation protein/uracil phosphoribosyltransferase
MVTHADSPNPAVKGEQVIFNAEDIQRTLRRLAHELIESNHGTQNLVILGMLTRGKYLGERLAKLLEEIEGKPVPVGYLDITLYRDDTALTMKPVVASLVPQDLTNTQVILVDDVLFSGRSVRAALDALNGYGRPSAVRLLVLLDRGHREFPIRPDYVGKSLTTEVSDRVSVRLKEVDGEDQVIVTH